MSKTVLFLKIQFNISTQFSSIWSIDRTLSGATTPNQSEHGSYGNEGVLRIPQTSPSDCSVSYPGHMLGGSYPSTEMKLVYSTVPTDWSRVKFIHALNIYDL